MPHQRLDHRQVQAGLGQGGPEGVPQRVWVRRGHPGPLPVIPEDRAQSGRRQRLAPVRALGHHADRLRRRRPQPRRPNRRRATRLSERVVLRLLIQTGRPLNELRVEDLEQIADAFARCAVAKGNTSSVSPLIGAVDGLCRYWRVPSPSARQERVDDVEVEVAVGGVEPGGA